VRRRCYAAFGTSKCPPDFSTPSFKILTAASPKHRAKESTTNPRREIFRPRGEEKTGKNVSAAKKIARNAKKLPEIQAKSGSSKRYFSLQYQLVSRWLGSQDSNLRMPEFANQWIGARFDCSKWHRRSRIPDTVTPRSLAA
jgi:hypothetical protein